MELVTTLLLFDQDVPKLWFYVNDAEVQILDDFCMQMYRSCRLGNFCQYCNCGTTRPILALYELESGINTATKH